MDNEQSKRQGDSCLLHSTLRHQGTADERTLQRNDPKVHPKGLANFGPLLDIHQSNNFGHRTPAWKYEKELLKLVSCCEETSIFLILPP